MSPDSAAAAQSGGPSFNREVLARLDAIEGRLESGNKRFDVMDEHVKDCAAEKQRVLIQMAVIEGQMVVIRNLVVALIALVGSGIVAIAILN